MPMNPFSNPTGFPQRAGVDITTGYGADSFLRQTKSKEPRDPWGPECFMSIVDAAINHREFYYPLPTTMSAETINLKALPLTIASLHQAAVLAPARQTTAEQLGVADESLEAEYTNFCDWAVKHSQPLKEWCDLHFQSDIKKQHKERVSKDVQPFIAEFWRTRRTRKLANVVGVKPTQLQYAFDVMFRGIPYYKILSPNEIYYFPHPIRKPLLGGQVAASYEEYTKRWSWGRLFANLVNDGKIGREPEEIAELVAALQAKVGSNNATWYEMPLTSNEKEWKDVITTIAGESALPVKIKNNVLIGIEAGLAIAGLATIQSTPVVSVGLAMIVLLSVFGKVKCRE